MWGSVYDGFRLSLAIFLRLTRTHLPLPGCRLLTFAMLGPGVWRNSRWLTRLAWLCCLWYCPNFPVVDSDQVGAWPQQLSGRATNATAMDVDSDGDGANLLRPGGGDVSTEAQLATLFGEDVSPAVLLRQEHSLAAQVNSGNGPVFCPIPG